MQKENENHHETSETKKFVKRKKFWNQEDREVSSFHWMTTYGDLMTLLLTFFVLYYASFSEAEEKLSEKLMIEVNEAQLQLIECNKELTAMQTNLKRFLKRNSLEKDINLELKSNRLTIVTKSSISFETGKAELKPDILLILDAIGNLVVNAENRIRVEGHTDNVPIVKNSSSNFPSNWELSSARASSIIRYFIEYFGINPERMEALGYGEYKPIFPNDTAENRSKNRRVEISIICNLSR